MEFKFKLHGQKVRARLLEDKDTVTEKTLMYYNGRDQFWRVNKADIESLKNASWKPVQTSVGDKVAEYPSYIFIEILSPFWKP